MRKMFQVLVASLGLALSVAHAADVQPKEIGTISSGFKLIGPNHGIKVVRVVDPLIPQMACYISFSQKGGMSGAFRNLTGMSLTAERNEMSVACRKMVDGPIVIPAAAKVQRNVFAQHSGGFFRSLNVAGMYDPEMNTMAYIVMADTVVDGSPKNSVTAVPLGF
jgi:CreA protein